jgi:hypothetical protein
MTKVPDGGDPTLKIFSSQLRRHQGALAGRLHDCEQQPRRKQRIGMAAHFLFRWHDYVEKKMCMTVDQAG